jgi:large-conductance mechanosensitive channel
MKNSKKTKTEKIKIIDIDLSLQKFKDSELSQAKTDGENIALNHPPIEVEKLKKIPTLQKIYTAYNSKSAEIGTIFQKLLEQLFTENQQAVADFNSSETSEAKAELENLEDEEKEGIDEAVVSHNETINDKKEYLASIKGNIKNLKATLRPLKHHTLWPLYVIGSVLIFLILIGEIVFNADSFEYAGYSRDYSRIIGTALATVTFMLSVALSFVIRKKWSTIIKSLVSLTIVGVVCSMYYTLGSIRVSMMTAQAESDGLFELTALHFMVFNFAFFTAIFAVKFFVFPTPQKVKENEEYRQVSTKLSQEEKKEKETKSEVNNAHKSREETKKAVKKDFAPRKAEVKNKIVDTSNRIKTSAVAFNEKLSTAKNFYTQVNNDYKTVASSLFATINLYRNDDISLPIPELENLDNPFDAYSSIPTFNGTK